MSNAAAELRAAPARRELLGVALILLGALAAGLWSLCAPLACDFGGYQGAFYSTTALSFERTGATRFGGYPYLLADEPALGGKDDLVPLEERDGRVYAYRNHPPTSFWIGWLGAKLLGPRGWQARHERGESPGVEHAVAAPFLLLHVAALGTLWWWLRAALGARAALAALLLAASAPAALHYGSLPNLENPCQPFVFAALGAHARWRSGASGRWLGACVLALALAACVTWAALFVALALGASELARRHVRAALGLLAAVALPFALQLAWSAHCVPSATPLALRPARLLEPLLDGSLPPARWLAAQLAHLGFALGLPLCALALAGLWRVPARARLALALAGGSTALYFVAFWRHTGEEQLQFQLWSVPVASLAGALALERVSPRARTLLLGFMLVAGGAGLFLLERHLERRDVPTPEASAAHIAALVPRGAQAVYDDALALNLAYAYCAWRALVAAGDARRWQPELLARGSGALHLGWDAKAREWRVAHW